MPIVQNWEIKFPNKGYTYYMEILYIYYLPPVCVYSSGDRVVKSRNSVDVFVWQKDSAGWNLGGSFFFFFFFFSGVRVVKCNKRLFHIVLPN